MVLMRCITFIIGWKVFLFPNHNYCVGGMISTVRARLEAVASSNRIHRVDVSSTKEEDYSGKWRWKS